LIEATTCARPIDLEGSLSVLGEKGSVVIEGFATDRLKTWHFSDESEDDRNTVTTYARNPDNIYGYTHIKFFEGVIDCIKNDRDGSITACEARKSLRLVAALYKSAETGREIRLDRFTPRHSKLGVTDGNL
jgi:predicted dehydrogenase